MMGPIDKKCEYCANIHVERDKTPCNNCMYNPKCLDHFKVHEALLNYIKDQTDTGYMDFARKGEGGE